MFMQKYYPYKLIISYNGTNYSGWQRQKSDFRTVQGEIESTLKQVLKHSDFSFYGSSRTDTGVHASGQVALLKLNQPIMEKDFLTLLNFNLPNSIKIMSLEQVSDNFNPQINVESKTYHYYFTTEMVSAVNEPFVTAFNKSLKIDLMIKACRELIGTHSFEAFTTDKAASKNTSRVINACEIELIDMPFQNNKVYLFKIEGSGFLKYMVRFIFAAIVMVGEGSISSEQFSHLITNQFQLDYKKAPAKGLHLFKINYSGK